MAIARVQASTAATSGTGAPAPAWPAATTAGDLLIAVVGVNTGATVGSWTPPAGWTLASQGSVGAGSHTAIFYIENASSRSGTETFTYSSSRNAWGVLIEYSGVATSASLDVTANASNGAGSVTPSTGTTATIAQNDELLLGGTANRNALTTTSDAMGGTASGGTLAKIGEASIGSGGTGLTGRAYEQIVTAAGTGEFHGTLGSSAVWSGAIATFKAAGGAPPPPPPPPSMADLREFWFHRSRERYIGMVHRRT